MPLVEFNTKTFKGSVILATEAAQRHARIMHSLSNIRKMSSLSEKEKIAIYKMLLDGQLPVTTSFATFEVSENK